MIEQEKKVKKKKTGRENLYHTATAKTQAAVTFILLRPDSSRVWQHDLKRYREENRHHREHLPGGQSLLGSRPGHGL